MSTKLHQQKVVDSKLRELIVLCMPYRSNTAPSMEIRIAQQQRQIHEQQTLVTVLKCEPQFSGPTKPL